MHPLRQASLPPSQIWPVWPPRNGRLLTYLGSAAYAHEPFVSRHAKELAHLIGDVAARVVAMTTFEDFVPKGMVTGHSIIGLCPPTDVANAEAFKAWRAAQEC
jgi:hypothetical protein